MIINLKIQLPLIFKTLSYLKFLIIRFQKI